MPNGLDMTVKVSIDVPRTTIIIKQRLALAFRDGVDNIVRDAKKLSPYQTGTNRRSIEAEVKATPSGVSAQVFTTSGYGGWLEIGSGQRRSRMEQVRRQKGTGGPTPYIRPAYELNKMGILESLRACLR
jgi:hypothetical protein